MFSNPGIPQNILKIGQDIYVTGIIVQLAFIILFGAMTIELWIESRRLFDEGRFKYKQQAIAAVLTALTLVMIRIIYRIVEIFMGPNENNTLLRSEIYPFMLDAFLMLLALTVLAIVHPGLVLRGPESEFPKMSRREKKTMKQQKKEEKKRAKEAKYEANRQQYVDLNSTKWAEDATDEEMEHNSGLVPRTTQEV